MSTQLRGLTFDQFTVGDEFVSPARTVTEADVVNFACLSGDFNPLHTDEEFARETPFGARIAHGMLLASMATGMAHGMGLFAGTAIAMMEQSARFVGATKFGDTVHLELKVIEKKTVSKPDRGIIIFAVKVCNQKGKAVIEGSWTLLLKHDERKGGGHETEE